MQFHAVFSEHILTLRIIVIDRFWPKKKDFHQILQPHYVFVLQEDISPFWIEKAAHLLQGKGSLSF